MNRFGVLWPDGSYTGGITDQQRLVMRYAQTDGGKWYEVGGANDPERQLRERNPICKNDEHYPRYGKHRVSECTTTKATK